MKIVIIFVVLSFALCFSNNINASCENAFFLHGVNDSRFQSRQFHFMKLYTIICKNCGASINLPSERSHQRFCSRKCGANYRINHPEDKSIGIGTLHQRIHRKYGKAYKCEQCGIEGLRRYHWASINHSYTENIEDWVQLCPTCHQTYDGKIRAIYQLDIEGKIINEFSSAVEAGKSINLSGRKVAQSTRYKTKCRGFYWQYKDDYGKPFKSFGHFRRVIQMDEFGNEIAEYKDAHEAAKIVGCTRWGIYTACNKKAKVKGSYWKYKEQQSFEERICRS